MVEDQKSIQDELSLPILLADRLIKSAGEAESYKPDCSDLGKQATQLTHMLRSLARLAVTTTTTTLYERPIRRVVSDVTKNLERALTLVRKCRKHGGILRQVFAIATTTDLRKVSNLVESSIGDLRWLLSIYDSDSGTNLSLPPIASNDPILAWVWAYIASLQMGELRDRVDAANELASLALDNDRNKKIIVAEGGIVPLLKLLKEGVSAEAQLAAATALYNLATDAERVRLILIEMGVPLIVKVLGDSPMRVQVKLVDLVAIMAGMDPGVGEEFGRENVTRPLVTLLSMDMVLEEFSVKTSQSGKTSLHSIVQINKEMTKNSWGWSNSNNSVSFHSNSSSSLYSDGTSRGGMHKRERENESPELKLRLKNCCALALWKLAKGSLLNSRKITETRALLCLAKLIENEKGELQINCLMTLAELAAVAESNADLRRAAFKLNSPAARAVLDQLLRVVNEEHNPELLVLAIRSIGSLARTFPAKETRIIEPLVVNLGHRVPEVFTETAIALGKFVCPDNFNRVVHSRAIIEFDGVPRLMNLLRLMNPLRGNDKGQVHGLILLCYLALNVGNSKALQQARVLNVLEGAARFVVAQHPDMRDLFAKAMHNLTLFQSGAHNH